MRTHRQFLHAPARARLGRSAAITSKLEGEKKSFGDCRVAFFQTNVDFNGSHSVLEGPLEAWVVVGFIKKRFWPAEVRGAAQAADSAGS